MNMLMSHQDRSKDIHHVPAAERRETLPVEVVGCARQAPCGCCSQAVVAKPDRKWGEVACRGRLRRIIVKIKGNARAPPKPK